MIAGIIYIIFCFGELLLFQKLGREPWEAIIPFWNLCALCEETLGSKWYVLTFFVPILNLFIWWKINQEIARMFNKDTTYAVGLFFLHPIFVCMIGFDNKL